MQIWTESIETRIVPIKRDSEAGQNDGTQGWKIFAQQPVLFSINLETRELAKSLYRPLFDPSWNSNTNVYLNSTIDLLFLVTTDSSSKDLARLNTLSHDDGDDEEPYHYNWRRENVLWDFYWVEPGMMRLAVDILCKHGGITNLALDFRNFHPASRDILRLETVKDQASIENFRSYMNDF